MDTMDAKGIKIEKTTRPKAKPDWRNLTFGHYYTDHMFVADYAEGRGWRDARIVPYAPLVLDPAAMVFHYAMEVFEGLKAYAAKDGRILLFRPWENAKRLNSSAIRICMPTYPEEGFLEAVQTLVRADADWVPRLPGTSLYLRPFMIATEPHLGVRRSNTFQLIVIASPVGAYYPEGLDPVKIYIEDEYVRAVRGGTGFTKCGGNYAASIIAQKKAEELGFTQVLWLDGVEKKYIEEVGAMNVMFKIGDEVVTPELGGSILPGVTRSSVLELLRSWGVKAVERRLSVDELHAAAKSGALAEAFGTGTAAVISPIGALSIGGELLQIADGGIGAVSRKLYDTLTGIQWGDLADPFGWTCEVGSK
ncbi:MAG: branched-chain amino acid aminotransferase [Acidobacteriota bacterium]|jgi:branched-chain amino acid aminotransferase|nr:branched-chain amino acid aminotransferase [Acidobacteriota bacterium]